MNNNFGCVDILSFLLPFVQPIDKGHGCEIPHINHHNFQSMTSLENSSTAHITYMSKAMIVPSCNSNIVFIVATKKKNSRPCGLRATKTTYMYKKTRHPNYKVPRIHLLQKYINELI